MNNNLDLDLNLNPPSAPSNVTPPSHNQTPRKKRTRRTSNNEATSSSSSRRKPDPNAPLITEPCKVCGKKFWSSKALHGHMRSHPERQWRGINPPPNHQPTAPPVSVTAEEGQVLANASTTGSSVGVEGRFECEGCKKVFESRQALDGHICSAILNLNIDPPPPYTPQEIVDEDDKSKSVMVVSGMNHRCDICSKAFSSGQALGGHMRRHWHKDRKEKKQASTGIDLNVPASTNLPGSSSDTLPESSLDLSPIAAGVSLRLMQAESNGVPMAHLLSSGQEISRVLVKLKGNSSEVVSKKPPKWRDENNRVELSRRKC